MLPGKLIGQATTVALIVAAFVGWSLFMRTSAINAYKTQLDIEALQRSAELAQRQKDRADTAEAELAEMKERTDEVLESLPVGGCDIPDDLLERLRGIE